MADRPIIFSAPMVRALLDGRKTQTRRLLNPQPDLFEIDEHGTPCQVGIYRGEGEAFNRVMLSSEGAGVITTQKVRYSVGDRLYVREAWSHTGAGVWTISDARRQPSGKPIYAADCEGARPLRWWPSIHMPREFSRLTLLVEDVRLQPLLDISEEDAAAEGFEQGQLDDGFSTTWPDGTVVSSPGTWASAAGHFQMLWSKLHPDWDGYSSPIVVALTFRVVCGNIDQVPA